MTFRHEYCSNNTSQPKISQSVLSVQGQIETRIPLKHNPRSRSQIDKWVIHSKVWVVV